MRGIWGEGSGVVREFWGTTSEMGAEMRIGLSLGAKRSELWKFRISFQEWEGARARSVAVRCRGEFARRFGVDIKGIGRGSSSRSSYSCRIRVKGGGRRREFIIRQSAE